MRGRFGGNWLGWRLVPVKFGPHGENLCTHQLMPLGAPEQSRLSSHKVHQYSVASICHLVDGHLSSCTSPSRCSFQQCRQRPPTQGLGPANILCLRRFQLRAGTGNFVESARAAEPGTHFENGTWREASGEGLSKEVEALALLVAQGSYVSSSLFHCLLRSCTADRDGVMGTRVHALVLKSGSFSNTSLADHIIRMYASHGSLQQATKVFDSVATPNASMWLSIILAHAEHGQPTHVIRLYKQMRLSAVKPNTYVFVAVLKACGAVADVVSGKEVHADIVRSKCELNVFLGSSLVNMYAKCGSLEDARIVFDGLTSKDVVSWNAMIAGYAQHGRGQESFSLFSSMQQEDDIVANQSTFVCLLKACASFGALHQGKELHSQIQRRGWEADVVLGSCLVDMYAKCGSLEDARHVFDILPLKDVIAWTAMIAGYAKEGWGQECLMLYADMQKDGVSPPDHVTFVCLLKACASVGALHQGEQLHAQILGRGLGTDLVVGNSLVDMYAKCGSLEYSRRVFDKMPARDVVTWNALLAGYAQHGLGQESLSLYSSMQQEGVCVPNQVTWMCLLKACASTGALHQGMEIHSHIQEKGLQADVLIGNCLLDMYAKCGNLDGACGVFETLPSRDVVAWNTMLAGYAQHGCSKEALHCYERMQLAGRKPDAVTFLALLSACRHAGLVDQGVTYFKSMSRDHGITPTIDHYVSMVDLFARAGHFKQVENMLLTMPMQPNRALWLCLLGGCRKHGNAVLGEQAFECAVHLDPKDAAAYLLMSQTYAAAGISEHATEQHRLREKQVAWKDPAQSWIEHDQEVYSFVVGDNHSQHEELYDLLEKVNLQLKKGIVHTDNSDALSIS